MLHTVSQLRDSVAGILSGIDINNVDDLNGAFERAARTLVQKADIPEASGVQNMVLYSGVYNYLCDTTIFGTAVTDLRPQGITRPVSDYVYKKPGEQFDRTKGFLPNGTMITFEYANGVPIIRVDSTIPLQQIIIDTMNSTTDWTAGGSASGLTQDNAVYYESPASLRFTLTGASTGTLTKTISSIDLSSYEGVGVAFLAIRIPDGATASNLTSVALKLGSDSGDYSRVTETEGFLGTWVAGDWLLVAFDYAGATDTETPDWSAIDYVQVSLTTAATMVNFRVGGLWICQPSPAQLLFQSNAIFVPSGSTTAQTSITAVTDTIILNDPAYNLYQYECALAVLEQTSGALGDAMSERITRKLDGNGVNSFGLYGMFRGDNPSQELRLVGNYYNDNDTYMGDYHG